jgi:hypothetical protein
MNYGQAIEVSDVRKEWQGRDDMIFQTQPKSYQAWMKEDEWDLVLESLHSKSILPLAEFKP